MASWYYAVGSQTQGPIGEDELQAMARRGELTPASYVVREGESVWQTLSEVESSLGLAASASGGYLDQATGVGGDAGQATTWGGPPPGQQPGWAAPGQTGQAGWSSEPQPQAWGQPPTDPYGAGVPGQYGAPAPGQYGAAPGQYGAAPGQYTPWSGAPTPGEQPGHYAISGHGSAPSASWGARLLAKVIDLLLVAVPGLILFWLVAGRDLLDRIDTDGASARLTIGGRQLLGSLLWYLIGFLYFSLLNGRGQTLGKMALGIKVVNVSDGAPIGVGKGFLRHIVQFGANLFNVCLLGYVFIMIDGLWPLWDARNQTLHDKIAGSIVVKAR